LVLEWFFRMIAVAERTLSKTALHAIVEACLFHLNGAARRTTTISGGCC
jgi:hypothetical protein